MKPDPTIEELREYIADKYKGLFDAETLKTDGEIAIYWFASEYHGGQNSNLYAALCATKYNPGRFVNSVTDENECIYIIFNSLIEKYDAEDGEYILDAQGERY